MGIRYIVKGLELTDDLEKYANGKVVRLTKKIPRRMRSEAMCEITFMQVLRKSSKVSTCHIVVKLGNVEFQAEEATQHLYAALDITVVDVEQQITKYLRSLRRSLLPRRRITPDK